MADDYRSGPANPTRLERVGMINTQSQFGAELTALREQAGLTVREAAAACGLAHTTAGGYFAGTHLPTPKLLGTQFTSLLQALGVEDDAELRAWSEAARRIRRAARRKAAEQELPYRGLARFEPEDASWFFGRDALTAALVERATRQREQGSPLIVVGASGAGKSSVLRAGLIPALRTGADVALCTPGREPSATLSRELSGPEGEPVKWIVVDQFEELFTHDVSVIERAAFIDELLAAAGKEDAEDRVGVVIGLRADFYAQALAQPQLAHALQDGQVVVGAMDRAQLREAIVGPAARAGAQIEDGLVELLIEQTVELGREHAGTLPLLSHALLTAWKQHDGAVLTTADYLATGGIAHAIARSAEEAFNDLTDAQRELARRVFLHLVHVAEGAADTARKVRPDQLPGASGSRDLPEAIGAFIDRRLLTADADTIQITHEALLASWPRLRSWLDADRADLLAQRRVAYAAESWHESGRDPAALLRGAPLAAVEVRMGERGARWHPTSLERDFLTASSAQRQLEDRAKHRANRRLQLLAGTLALLLTAAVGLATFALAQRENAQMATRLANSRAVAEAAINQRGLDPSVAAQLSLSAYRIAPTAQARSALLDSTATARATRVVDGSSVVQALAVGPNLRLVSAADADGSLRLWDTANPAHPTQVGGPLANLPNSPLYAVAISPNGHLLAASGAQDTIGLWNITNPADPIALHPLTGAANTVYGLTFNASGTLLAAASADGTVRLWHLSDMVATPTKILSAPPAAYVQSVTFSPDGRTLAAGTSDGRLLLWSVASDGGASATAIETNLGGAVLALAFSPDGHTLATGTKAKALQFWKSSGPGLVQPDGAALAAGTSWINALAFSPDGSELAVGSSANTVQIWSPAARDVIASLPHPEPVVAVAWDGLHTLMSGCADGIIRLWKLPIPQIAVPGVVNSVVFSPDGRLLTTCSETLQLWNATTLASLSAGFGPSGLTAEAAAFDPAAPLLVAAFSDGTLRLFDIADPAHPIPVGQAAKASASGYVESVAFNKTGTVIATGDDDATVRLWQVAKSAQLTAGRVLTGFAANVFDVTFSSDGTTLAAASIDRSVRLWHVPDAENAQLLGSPIGFSAYAYSVAFSPNGTTLAVGIANGTVHLLNMANAAHPTSEGPALTGPSGYVYALAFSPDGSMLAGAVTDDNLWLWDVTNARSPTALATLTGTTHSLFTVAFSPSGSTLAASGADSVVRFWQPDAIQARDSQCAGIGEPLTPADWARYAPGLPFTAPCA